MNPQNQVTEDAVAGAILGCAVGDAIGLPYEGLSARRGIRLFGDPVRHRFLLARGMVSDDTEHTCMVAQALCAAPTDPAYFARVLAGHLRWWLLGIPAGIGLATLRAILKLWCGFPPTKSGVFSAGNGPAMRSAILGAAIDDLEALKEFTRASTQITHTDPKAFLGAMAVAVAAWCSRRSIRDADGYFEQLLPVLGEECTPEFHELLEKVRQSLRAGNTTREFARQLCGERGVSGYVYRTVPVVLHGWLSRPTDFREAIQEVITCGGDTDTTAAILGGIIGAGIGVDGLPQDWLNCLCEWPRSVDWMKRLAIATTKAMQESKPVPSPKVIPLVGLGRNLLFASTVMVHVVRRMLPPY